MHLPAGQGRRRPPVGGRAGAAPTQDVGAGGRKRECSDDLENGVRLAKSLGIDVTGSEVVGLIPKEALLMAGRYYSGDPEAGEKGLIDRAIECLGLSQIERFEPEKKIIEYMIKA